MQGVVEGGEGVKLGGEIMFCPKAQFGSEGYTTHLFSVDYAFPPVAFLPIILRVIGC